jgi:hypothetical protein
VKPVLLVPDEGAVEEFVAAGLHPPFQDGVHPWHLEDDLDSRIVEDGVEQLGEFAVAVPDQESRPTAGVLEVNGQVLRRVRYPGCGGVRGGAQDVDSPGGVLMTASTCRRAPVRVMVSTKSQERRASAGERRKSAQVLDERSGAGSILASVRISQTVEAATLIPRTTPQR